ADARRGGRVPRPGAANGRPLLGLRPGPVVRDAERRVRPGWHKFLKNNSGAAHFPRQSGIDYRTPSARWVVMNVPERQIMSLLGEAVEPGWPEERAAFLDRACAGDARRRARVEELLRAYQAAGNFLQGHPPPPERTATADEQPVREGPGTVIGPYK